MMRDNRIGRFVIPVSHIDENPGAVREALAGLIVVRAEMMWATDSIEYMALGPCFDPVQRGAEVPTYEATFELTNGHASFVRWQART